MTATATDYRAIFDTTPCDRDYRAFCRACHAWRRHYATEYLQDRYGFDCAVDCCPACGLRYFSTSINVAAYANFYQSGAYRRLVSAYHGREMGPNGEEYSLSVREFLQAGGVKTRSVDMLDVGGSEAFGIAGWWERISIGGLRTDVIDPAIDGQTAETFDPAGRTWDLITVCQTVDHLLEPGAVFKKLATCLAPAGVLFFDAVDFDATKEYKIDHPCNFNARSATMLAHVAGLRIDKMERAGNHLRFLCRHW